MNSKYLEFLKSKIETAPVSGFSVPEEDINQALKPHQRDAVRWALRGGRRALFESFGLGKTVQELEFCHHAAKHEGRPALIVLPLGVRQEFKRDAVNILGYEEPVYVRTMQEVRENAGVEIMLTNMSASGTGISTRRTSRRRALTKRRCCARLEARPIRRSSKSSRVSNTRW